MTLKQVVLASKVSSMQKEYPIRMKEE